MVTKQPLRFEIEDAAPELDFLFAYARRVGVSLTISIDGRQQDTGVFIDSLSVVMAERAYSEKDRDPSPIWNIEGHFYGNGKTSWSTFCHGSCGEYQLWGGFKGVYNKKTRKGWILVAHWDKVYKK